MKRADHYLVQQVLDGDVSREIFDGFQKRLREEPDLARLYEDYALLQHTLSEEYEGGHSVTGNAVPSRKALVLPIIAGLCILLAALWWLRPHLTPAAKDDVAMTTFSLDAVWHVEGGSRSIGAATGLAKDASIHLLQGRAAISLEPAITALIEGPATVTIRSDHALHLAHGRGWFQCGANSGGLTVTTPKLTAVDSGTAFGVTSSPESADEVRVDSGTVRVTSSMPGRETVPLHAGNAARVSASGFIERIPVGERAFATNLGRFSSVVSGPFDTSQWSIQHGNPAITQQGIEGGNFAIFMRLPHALPSGDSTVMLATLDLAKSAEGQFHTDGWAGMSFFSGDTEVLFFGDPFGTKPTWALDVKQHIPVMIPKQPVSGPREITLRYDLRTGGVSLHEGGLPLAAPFCSGKLPPGTRFDAIRIGASAGAALAVDALHIRVGGG